MEKLKSFYLAWIPALLPWLFGIYIVSGVIGSTIIVYENSAYYMPAFAAAMKLIRYLIYACMAAKCLLDFILGYTDRKLVLLFGLYTLLVFVCSHQQQFVIMNIAILSCCGLKPGRILRLFSGVMIFSLLLELAGCSAHLFPNELLNASRFRNSLGFYWASVGPVFYFFFLLARLSLSKPKLPCSTLFFMAFLVVFYFFTTNFKLTALLSCTAIALYVLQERKLLPVSLLYRPWTIRLILVLPALLAVLSFLLAWLYSDQNSLLVLANKVFNNRLSQSHLALERLSIPLFGQDVPWNGFGAEHNDAAQYFFVDNSYLKICLDYGLVTLLGILCLYTGLLAQSIHKKQTLLTCMLVLLLVFGMSEPWLADARCNPFLFFLSGWFLKTHPSVWKILPHKQQAEHLS